MIRSFGDLMGIGLGGLAGRHRVAALIFMLSALAAFAPVPAVADEHAEQSATFSLDIIIVFPDAGLALTETLCVELYPDDGTDLAAATLLQRACLTAEQDRARFVGLAPGVMRAVVPAADSMLAPPRYAGQVASVEVPDDPNNRAFEIDVTLTLTPEFAGTTGVIQVSVYGCPPGTNGGGDATVWRQACDALIGGTSVSVSGIGTIEATAQRDVTAQDGATFGRVEFANLPAGEYQLEGDLPPSVTANPAYFVESSIDGGLPTPIDPSGPLAVRPTEIIAVDVYVPLTEPAPVLEPESEQGASVNSAGAVDQARSADPSIVGDESAPIGSAVDAALTGAAGLGEPVVTGGLAPPDPAPTDDEEATRA